MNATNLITRGRDSWCYVNARRTDGRFLLLFNLLEWLLANLNKTEQEGYKVCRICINDRTNLYYARSAPHGRSRWFPTDTRLIRHKLALQRTFGGYKRFTNSELDCFKYHGSSPDPILVHNSQNTKSQDAGISGLFNSEVWCSMSTRQKRSELEEEYAPILCIAEQTLSELPSFNDGFNQVTT